MDRCLPSFSSRFFEWQARCSFRQLAVIWGCFGVLLWPIYYVSSGSWISYPLELHSRLMLQGFVGCMILHQLYARVLRPPGRTTLVLLCAANLTFAVANLSGQFRWGDTAFALLLSITIWQLWRQRHRVDSLSRMLWLATLLTGGGAAMLLHLSQVSQLLDPLVAYHGRSLLHTQVFPVFGLLAAWPKAEASPRTIGVATVCILAIWALSMVEALGFQLNWDAYPFRFPVDINPAQLPCHLGRCGLVILLAKVIGLRTPQNSSSVWKWVAGFAIAYVWLRPMKLDQAFAINHTLLMGSVALAWMTTLMRPNTQGESPVPSQKVWRWWLFLVILATITRLTPIWVPSTTMSHHIYAALTWVAVLFMWRRWRI